MILLGRRPLLMLPVPSERSQDRNLAPAGEEGRGLACQEEFGGPVAAFHNRGIKVSIWLCGVVQIWVSTSFR